VDAAVGRRARRAFSAFKYFVGGVGNPTVNLLDRHLARGADNRLALSRLTVRAKVVDPALLAGLQGALLDPSVVPYRA